MNKKAVIDIGSNSMRVVIYEVNKDKGFLIIDEEKKIARLGNYLVDNRLTAVGINLAINTLKAFKSLCENYDVVDIDVVATEAVRKAENRSDFCKKVFLETGLNIKILSGKEEGFFGYLAIKHTMDLNQALLFDIGGSSLELTLVKDGLIDNIISLPFGAIPLTKKFNNVNSEDEKNDIKEFITNVLKDVSWIEEGSGINIIGIGGAVRTIGKIHKKIVSYPLDIMHNYSVSRKDIVKIYEEIQAMDPAQRFKVKGLSKDRSDIFVAPLGAIATLMDYCNSEQIKISEVGIREGIIYDKVLKGEEVDNLDFSLRNIVFRNNIDMIHGNRIYDLSKRVFNCLECNKDELELLKTSAIIHEIGKNISVKGRHNHAFYTITNSNIMGLSHKENIMVAYIVAQLWKSEYKLPQPYKELLSKEDLLCCKKVSIVLYIGYMLERYLNGRRDSITINLIDDILEINFIFSELNYIAENINDDRYKIFKEVFNKSLVFKS